MAHGTSTSRKTHLLIEIDESRAEELKRALERRGFIRILSLTRTERKKLVFCPLCNLRLGAESKVSIRQDLCEALCLVAEKMSKYRGVVLVNRERPLAEVLQLNLERTVELPAKMVRLAVEFGFLWSWREASEPIHALSLEGVEFLRGKKPHRPSWLVVADGMVLERGGEILVSDVAFKDLSERVDFLARARQAINGITPSILEFLQTGQTSLISEGNHNEKV